MGKYEKRVLKIWEKWNPDGGSESELEGFISEYHPSVVQMTKKINDIVQSIIYGIELMNAKKREKFIEDSVYRSWDMVDNFGEDFAKDFCDSLIRRTLWGIIIGDGGSSIINGEEIPDLYWKGKSKFNMNVKDLDDEWDSLWDKDQDEQHWGSNQLKDWIWDRRYFGLKRELLGLIQQAQRIIPEAMQKEIKVRINSVNNGVDIYASQWEEYYNRDIDIDKMRSGDKKRPSINTFYFAEDLWKDLGNMGVVKRIKEEKESLKGSRRYNKDLGNVILEVDEYGSVQLNFKDDIAAQLEGWKTLEGMKDGWFLDGNTKRDYGDKYEDDGIWFTPEWGECKGISDIEDFIKEIGIQRKIKEAYFWCRWLKEESDNFPITEEIDVENPDNTKESEEKLIKEHTIERYWARHSLYEKNSYFHLKDDEVEEIIDRDLPHKGCLTGGGDTPRAYALSNNRKEWEWDGKKWTEDSYLRYRNPKDHEDEED